MNKGLLVVCATVMVLVVAASVHKAEAQRYQLPMEMAEGMVFTQGEGIAQAFVFTMGSYNLHAASYLEGDHAVATAVWETTVSLSGEGEARASFRLGHSSGDQATEWWGQMCCNAEATPYVITPDGQRVAGPVARLDGVPLDQAATHVLQALDTLEGSRWIPEAAWEAAAMLAEAPEDELGLAFAELLQALESELGLVLLTNALSQLGYLRSQEVVFTFPAEEDGTYTLGLEVETRAFPVGTEGSLVWSLGELKWAELEIGGP